ncbi:MAG: MBL fold metallo-hydrolase [Clostridiales bacterium]|nr:MBL fold metallo-hydrolase [Clostridiales bacterium]
MQTFSDGWYTASNIKEGVWAIDDNGQDNFYAVLGKERSLMIDTGFGAGDLGALTQKLSHKPWFAVNTHCDFDHCLGNDFFNTVYIGPGDIDTLNNTNPELIRKRLWIDPEINKTDRNWGPGVELGGTRAKQKTLLLEDGQSFDLGGRTVTAYHIPGHSVGSMCFIDDKSRTCFMGDMYVPLQEWNELWCHMDRCTSVAVILNSINRVRGLKSKFDLIVSGHGSNYALEAGRLDEFAEGLEGIVSGRIVGEPVETVVGPGYAVRFNHVGIIYNPNKIV